MKRQLQSLLLLISVVVLMITLGGVAAQGNNLLSNPGFESPFENQGGTPERQVANGWVAWNVPAEAGAPNFENTQPEYYETAPDTDRIRNGNNAQNYYSFFATHTGGVYQVVNSGVQSGDEIEFTLHAYVWSSTFDDEDESQQDGDVLFQVGIDPTGGTDGTSEDILWSVAREQYDSYNAYTINAIAEANQVSVWVRSRVGFPVKNTSIYLDDASLTVVGDSVVTQEPTEEPTQEPTEEPTQEPTEDPTQEPTEEPTQEVITPTPEDNDDFGEGGPGDQTQAPPTATDDGAFPDRVIYTVQPGDTVSRLATRFNSSIQAIISANGLNQNGLIFVGQGLVIPVRDDFSTETPTPPPAVTQNPGTGGPEPGQNYLVRRGDTLTTIASRFNTTVPSLAQLNGIVNPDRIQAGQVLFVPGAIGGPTATVTPVTPVVATPRPIATPAPVVPVAPTRYVVQPGENLFRISLRFGVSLSELARANQIIDINRIFAGQTLIIP